MRILELGKLADNSAAIEEWDDFPTFIIFDAAQGQKAVYRLEGITDDPSQITG